MHRWLPSKQTRVKPSTANSYERNIQMHINPYIGAIPLQRLQHEDLDELHVKLFTDGKRNGAEAACRPSRCATSTSTCRERCPTRPARGTVARNVADTADSPSIRRSGRFDQRVDRRPTALLPRRDVRP